MKITRPRSASSASCNAWDLLNLGCGALSSHAPTARAKTPRPAAAIQRLDSSIAEANYNSTGSFPDGGKVRRQTVVNGSRLSPRAWGDDRFDVNRSDVPTA